MAAARNSDATSAELAASGQKRAGRYSLATMLLLLVMATALPLVGLGIYAALRTVAAEVERANATVLAMADATAVDTAATLDEFRRLLTFLAQRDAVRALDPAACDPLFADILRLRKDLVNVASVDLEGKSKCGVLKGPDGRLRDVGQPLWLQAVREQGDFAIGSPQRGIYSGRWVLVLAYPVRDAEGRVRGAVEAVVALEAFQPLAQSVPPVGGMLGIYNREGVVIARVPETERLVGQDLSGSPLVRMVRDKQAGVGTTTGQAGIERLHAFKPIGDSGWYAVSGLPTASIYAPARRSAWLVALIGTLVLVAAGAMVMLIQRRIARPILALATTARRVAGGDLAARAPVLQGLAEADEAAAGLNQMLDRMPAMEHALRASEARYRKLVEAAPEAIVVHRSGRILLANRAAAFLYGAPHAGQLEGRALVDLTHPDSRALAQARSDAAQAGNDPLPPVEQRHLRLNGGVLEVETVPVRLEYEGETAVLVLIRDIGVRKAAERRVNRLTNLYAALSGTNELISRESDLQAICAAVCDVAVGKGGLTAALVRRPNPESGLLEVWTRCGGTIGWVADLKIAPDHPFNNGARVFREGGFHVSNDYASDENARETRDELQRAGIRSSAIFAIVVDGRTVALFSVFADEEGYFDPELVALLRRMADNLGFAFGRERELTMRRDADRRLQRLSNLYVALSRTNEAIFRIGTAEELFAAVNDIAVSHGGLKSAVIRIIDPQTRMLVPHAYRGPDADWIGRRAVSLDDAASNVAGVARAGGHFVSNDILNDPAVAVLYDDAVLVGVRSTATYALWMGGAIAGTLSVGAAEENFFDAGLLGLIGEMADNLSFALARQKEAAELASSEARYRALFDASPDAIRVICEDRVVMLNPAGVRLFGLGSADQMIGRPVYDLIAPESREQARERIRAVVELRQALPPVEELMLCGDGGTLEMEVTRMPFDYNGKPAALVIMRDLTERKENELATQRLNSELEERVQQRTAELRHANAELESFSYSVAHDLRSPLRTMTGFAQLLAMDVAAGDTGELASHVKRITDNAEKMNRLIDGLLNVSNSAHRKLAVERIDMRSVAEDVVRELAARERARVVIGPMPSVDGDPAAIRQVWTNLLSNALKYSAKKSQPLIELDCDLADDMAVFRVKDNGVGFNAAYAEKLFGVFSRLHSASDYEGVGIGLAIVKRVVERHGGRVWAESSPNAGATFYFSLPLAAPVQQASG